MSSKFQRQEGVEGRKRGRERDRAREDKGKPEQTQFEGGESDQPDGKGGTHQDNFDVLRVIARPRPPPPPPSFTNFHCICAISIYHYHYRYSFSLISPQRRKHRQRPSYTEAREVLLAGRGRHQAIVHRTSLRVSRRVHRNASLVIPCEDFNSFIWFHSKETMQQHRGQKVPRPRRREQWEGRVRRFKGRWWRNIERRGQSPNKSRSLPVLYSSTARTSLRVTID